jgi:hypothetical protein
MQVQLEMDDKWHCLADRGCKCCGVLGRVQSQLKTVEDADNVDRSRSFSIFSGSAFATFPTMPCGSP